MWTLLYKEYKEITNLQHFGFLPKPLFMMSPVEYTKIKELKKKRTFLGFGILL